MKRSTHVSQSTVWFSTRGSVLRIICRSCGAIRRGCCSYKVLPRTREFTEFLWSFLFASGDGYLCGRLRSYFNDHYTETKMKCLLKGWFTFEGVVSRLPADFSCTRSPTGFIYVCLLHKSQVVLSGNDEKRLHKRKFCPLDCFNTYTSFRFGTWIWRLGKRQEECLKRKLCCFLMPTKATL